VLIKGHRERQFGAAALILDVALATAVLAAVVGENGTPRYGLVAFFAALVVLAENLSVRFPSPVALSPQLVLLMTAMVAIQGPSPKAMIFGIMVIGACGGLLLEPLRGRRYVILAFNVGQLGLSAGAAALCYTLLQEQHDARLLVWIPTVLSYLAVNIFLTVPLAALKSGTPIRDVWADVRISELCDFFFGLAGLGLGTLYNSARPSLHIVILLVVVGVAVIAQAVYVSFLRLRQAYTRLETLYRFTQRLEGNRDEPDAAMSVLDELRSVMGAGTAELITVSGDGWRRITVVDGQRRPDVAEGTDRPVEADFLTKGPIRVIDLPVGDPLRVAVEGRMGEAGMVAPMRADGDLMGRVVGIGQPVDGRTFKVEDLRLLEALANHAAVTLDNSRLLGRLRYDSHHDLLTALPNRARFNELIADLPNPSAILLIDLDRFKEINDTVGHQYGDLLLLSVAERITQEVAHRGIVARLGGDEFGVLLPQTGSGDAAQCAVSLLAAIEQPFAVGELELEITASIGVAVAHASEVEPGRLLQQADVAMYSAKESHSGWEVYSSERDHYSPRRLALAGELRHAIEDGELEVHYQPKSDLRTGAVRGVEALVRWRHPRYGIIGPDQFIPVAESAGLIRPLTFMVLTHAVRHVRELQGLGYNLEVAVNLSVRSVLDVNLPDQIAQVLAAHDMPASKLTLEITEGSVMADPSRTIGILGRLANLGASISVDDFGTGYSSLSYLKRLPATEVKIDRSFVAGMLTNDSDAAIVRSTVDLARNLGLRAVAEGVEDQATWDALAALGCDYAQGFFVSPALTAEDLRSWLLRRHPAIDPSA
jgi:diguanylate cyclase (GGDEF)-like protein